jgi:hypothetical protein
MQTMEDDIVPHLNAHHDAQVDKLLESVESARAQGTPAGAENAQASKRTPWWGRVVMSKRQRDEHDRLQEIAYRGMFCIAGVCPAPVCNCEAPQGGWQFNSIQFKNRPKEQCTKPNDNRSQTNCTTKPSIGAATNPDTPMSLATRSSQSTSC